MLTAALLFRVSRTAHSSRALLARLLESINVSLSPEEAMGLGVIARFQQNTVSGVAEALHRDRTTVTRLLDGLEQKGLVVRFLSDEDRRVTRVQVTDEGNAVGATIRAASSNIFPQLLQHLSTDALREALRTLEILSESQSECLKQLESGGQNLEEF